VEPDYTVESSNPETHPDVVETQDLLVSIEGVDLADEDRSRVQTELQRTVRAKIEELRQAGSEVAENRTLVSTPTDEIGVALRGLPLTEEGMRLIESSVRETVAELLPAEAAARASSSNGRISVERNTSYMWFLDTLIAQLSSRWLYWSASAGQTMGDRGLFPTSNPQNFHAESCGFSRWSL
jgi:hypothetical protein